MTRETDQFRKNRVLETLESLAVRLEVVVGYLERKVAIDLEAVAPVEESEAQKRVNEEVEEAMEKRRFEAEQLAARVASGEITEEEKEEYMGRWLRGPS